eukprot:CAMPEP_0113934806 /NCGR_PEP_ID=MMETSP1339-20121228/2080_1 /TAXON_ID=94617 /ORGANISM="Fibrocapsa japonica" /LENGTH=127 /DNA_ID=CAMNT_0000936747 /DNA_START=70 /DNA_END=450 /DNA_ORIENTATION=+ /assembly_acc=CAM_ASM_000762
MDRSRGLKLVLCAGVIACSVSFQLLNGFHVHPQTASGLRHLPSPALSTENRGTVGGESGSATGRQTYQRRSDSRDYNRDRRDGGFNRGLGGESLPVLELKNPRQVKKIGGDVQKDFANRMGNNDQRG